MSEKKLPVELPLGVKLISVRPVAGPLQMRSEYLVVDVQQFIETNLRRLVRELTGTGCGCLEVREIVANLKLGGVELEVPGVSGGTQNEDEKPHVN